MCNMTLLNSKAIFGKHKLEIFEKYGTRCAITDFAILQVGEVLNDIYTSEGNGLKNRSSKYWIIDDSKYLPSHSVSAQGKLDYIFYYDRSAAIRPVLPYSIVPSNIKTFTGINGVKMIEYCECPKWVTSKEMGRKLEKEYRKKRLKETGEIYTTDLNALEYNNKDLGFKEHQYIVYEYEGEKYVRVDKYRNYGERLSDGRIIEGLDVYWVKVEKVKWLVDEENDMIVSKDSLVSGIQWSFVENKSIDFDKTILRWYLNTYLFKELTQGQNYLYDNPITKNDTLAPNNLEIMFSLISDLSKIEVVIDSDYIQKKEKINEIRNTLNSILNQTNEVSEDQLSDVKKKIKKLY